MLGQQSDGTGWADGAFRRREVLLGGGLTLAWLAVGSLVPERARAASLALGSDEQRIYAALVEAVFDDSLGTLGVLDVTRRFADLVLLTWGDDWRQRASDDLAVLERAPAQGAFSTLSVAQRRAFLAQAGYDPRVPASPAQGDAALIPVVVVGAIELAYAPDEDDLLSELLDLLQEPFLDDGDTDVGLYLDPVEG